MTGDARQFAIELTREWEAKQEEVAEAVALLAMQGLRGVVNKSPVDTGRFKGNWIASIGAVDLTTSEQVDPGGGATISEGTAVLVRYGEIEGFPSIFLQNNLPYATRLEDGYSAQAPAGMVALTVAELQAQWNAITL